MRVFTVEEMDRALRIVDTVRARTAPPLGAFEPFGLPAMKTIHYAAVHAAEAERNFGHDITRRQAFMVGWLDGLVCGIALTGEVSAE